MRRRRRKPLWTSSSALCGRLYCSCLFPLFLWLLSAAATSAGHQRGVVNCRAALLIVLQLQLVMVFLRVEECFSLSCSHKDKKEQLEQNAELFILLLLMFLSSSSQCSGHVLKTYNRLKKWNKSEAWTKYLITDVVVVVLTVFLHPYAGVLWLIGAAGARSVFLCLITCFLFESESIYTELQARGRNCEKWQELSAQCHLVGELSSYQLKSFSVISL